MNSRTPEEHAGCPGRDTLADFQRGKLPAADLEGVAEHLSGCPRCEAALRDIQGSPGEAVSAWLRRWLDCSSFLAEHGLARMQAAAEVLLDSGGEGTTDPEHGRVAAAQRWLGRTVGHYEIVEKLGQGGMGVVYKARQAPLGRWVALKMILAGVHAGEHTLARFAVEGAAAGRLQHAGVVQVYEFAEHEGLPYYTMELVEGGSLEKRLREGGPLEPHAAAALVRTLALTIAFAHAKVLLAYGYGAVDADTGFDVKVLDKDGNPLPTTIKVPITVFDCSRKVGAGPRKRLWVARIYINKLPAPAEENPYRLSVTGSASTEKWITFKVPKRTEPPTGGPYSSKVVGIDPSITGTIEADFVAFGTIVEHTVTDATMNNIGADYIYQDSGAGFWVAQFPTLQSGIYTLTVRDSGNDSDLREDLEVS